MNGGVSAQGHYVVCDGDHIHSSRQKLCSARFSHRDSSIEFGLSFDKKLWQRVRTFGRKREAYKRVLLISGGKVGLDTPDELRVSEASAPDDGTFPGRKSGFAAVKKKNSPFPDA